MHETHLGRVDLNLLPSLVALLEERHVSKAADRVGLSQSAMSRCLQRLRREFSDELLARGRDGFVLTPRAEQIRRQLLTVLPQLESVFSATEFVPATSAESFQLAGSDYAVSVFGAALFRRVLSESTESVVRFHPWHPQVFDELESGNLDLIFFGAKAPAPLQDEVLFTDEFVCVVSHDHPLAAGTKLSLTDYLAAKHLVIDITNGLQPAIDRVLIDRGTPRTAALTVPFHATASASLAGTSLILTMPARLVASHITPSVDSGSLCILPAPRAIRDMTYVMAWHPRLNDDSAHRWLRAQVRASVH